MDIYSVQMEDEVTVCILIGVVIPAIGFQIIHIKVITSEAEVLYINVDCLHLYLEIELQVNDSIGEGMSQRGIYYHKDHYVSNQQNSLGILLLFSLKVVLIHKGNIEVVIDQTIHT